MISKRIDALVCDFDSTLCIHDPLNTHTDRDRVHWYAELMYGLSPYCCSRAPQSMKDFLSGLVRVHPNCRVSMCSQMYLSIELNNKIEFLKENYPDIKWDGFVGAGRVEDKIMYLKSIADCYKFNCENIAIIDDRYDVLDMARKEGFQGIDPIPIFTGVLTAERFCGIQ